MISLNHVRAQLAGFWAMAFNQPDWQSKLERGPEAILASFWAMVPAGALTVCGALLVPALFSMMSTDPAFVEALAKMDMQGWQPAPAFVRVLVAMLSFFFAWFLTLGMLLRIARRLEGTNAMADIIVGYNWLQVPFRTIGFAPIALILVTGNAAIGGLVALPLFGLGLSLVWGMLRRALPNTDWTVIIGIIICMGIAAFVSGIMASIIGALFYVPPTPSVTG